MKRLLLRASLPLALIIILCFCMSFALADTQSSLKGVIDQALLDPVLAHGIQGVLIESLKDGRVIYDKNSDLLIMPASNMKILTSAASLDLLGPDYKMTTSLYISGKRTNGILKGDVILVGRGDPVFKYEHLQEMAKKIKALGIKTIEGSVIGDDTWFDGIPLGGGWSWDYLSDYYAAEISGLNLNENVVEVWVKPGRKVGAPALAKVEPSTSYMTIENTCTTSPAGSAKSVLVFRRYGKNVISVSGTVPLDYKPEGPEDVVTMQYPTVYTCQKFIEMLRHEGVTVKGRAVRGKKPEGAELVMAHDSPPMSEMIKLLLKPSDNLIAECLFRSLGAKLKGKGSSSAAEEAELDFLKKIGADDTAIAIADGSGLSRYDGISPMNMVVILKYMHDHKNFKAYYDALPIAGVDGTLRRRMKGTSAEGNVHAKTGYIGRVRCLSGYVTTKSGEPLVFSIMLNNHLCKSSDADALIDKIVTALAELDG